MRAFRATAQLAADDGRLGGTGAPSCRVLNLILGPLDLNLLGLVVELFGPNRQSPVTLTITSFPGQGVLGDLFCSLSGGPRLRQLIRSAPWPPSPSRCATVSAPSASGRARRPRRPICFGRAASTATSLLTTARAAGSAPLDPAAGSTCLPA